MEAVFHWVSTYGYEAIFFLLVLGIVGLPVPDETLLVFCGYLIATGKMHPAATYIAAAGGSLCGMTISYWIGRTLGIGVVHKFGRFAHLDDRKLEMLHRWFDRRGHWLLFIGYYIAGVRHFTAIIAGASHLEFSHFALFAFSGGLLWVASFLTLGYVIGDNWREIAEAVHQYMHFAAYTLIAAVLIYLLFRWVRRPARS
jgi:membrane protein DedA with SNARE-associated domain